MVALHNPLLEGMDIQCAKGLLLNISGSSSMTMDEFDQVCKVVTEQLDNDVIIIVGMVVDEELADQIKVTVIATGINSPPPVKDSKTWLAKNKVILLAPGNNGRSLTNSLFDTGDDHD